MRLPRDLDANDLIKALAVLGYRVEWQTGSHIRVSTEVNGRHRISIPAHDPLKVGMLSSILKEIAAHHGYSRNDLLRRLDL